MISTAMNASRPCGKLPASHQPPKAMTAVPTTGRHEVARHLVGDALDRRAAGLRVLDHLDDLRQRRLRADARAWKRKLPVRLSVPPITAAPVCLSTGIDSPVSMDSSTDECLRRPRRRWRCARRAAQRPSRRPSPARPGSRPRPPSQIACAVAGFRSSSLRTAAEECFLMISSMYLPSSTKAMITRRDLEIDVALPP